MVEDILKGAEEGMQSSVEHFTKEMSKVRTGRASANLLDSIKVDYYGASTPLAQVATVSIPDARTILVQPFEKSQLAEIEKGIMKANLGLNPNNDGSVIRVPVPLLTEERRKDIVKTCGRAAEDSRVAIRTHRRTAIDAMQLLEKEKAISEDELKSGEADVMDLTKKYIEKVDAKLKAKEAEVMQV